MSAAEIGSKVRPAMAYLDCGGRSCQPKVSVNLTVP